MISITETITGNYDHDDDDICFGCFMSSPDCECCPACDGLGERPLLSGLEWDYVGSDVGECPNCGGSGKR